MITRDDSIFQNIVTGPDQSDMARDWLEVEVAVVVSDTMGEFT